MAPASSFILRSTFLQTRRLSMIELLSLCSLMLSPAGCDPASRAFAQPSAADVTRVAPSAYPDTSDVVDNGETFETVISATGHVVTDDKANLQRSVQRAELPRVFLDFQFPAVTGRTITVSAGGNLQSALNKAQRGDEIVLAAGATFTGNFVLPTKPGTEADGWIVVRSEQLDAVAAAGDPGLGGAGGAHAEAGDSELRAGPQDQWRDEWLVVGGP